MVFPWCLGSLERDVIGIKVDLNLPWDLVEFRGLQLRSEGCLLVRLTSPSIFIWLCMGQ